jgi:uncharacterized protein YabE (DUF348 family)
MSLRDISVEVNVLSETPRVNPADHLGITEAAQITVKYVQQRAHQHARGCAAQA